MTALDLGGNVSMIDTAMGGYSGITASYLIRSSRPCLIETGTALSAPHVVASLGALGVDAADLASIVVTHIHLDHAGGVGDLARAFPNAKVVVHERGARHLADPSRLVSSARMVFGEAMDRLFGDLAATPAERLQVIGETGAVDLGDGRSLSAFHNPGHASHHLGLIDSETGDLYTGDAAGVYVPQTAELRPATPPPDFDLELALSSLAAMRAVGPQRLLFSHFGPVDTADDTLEQSADALRQWVAEVDDALAATSDLDHAIAMVQERDRAAHPALYADADALRSFEELSSVAANVSGVSHWRSRQQPQ